MIDAGRRDESRRLGIIVELASGVAIFVLTPIAIGALFLLVVLPEPLPWIPGLGFAVIAPFGILAWLAGIGWVVIGRPRIGCSLMAVRVLSVLVGAIAAERITHGTGPIGPLDYLLLLVAASVYLLLPFVSALALAHTGASAHQTAS